MRRTNKNQSKNQSTELLTAANAALPAPAVDDATTTKGAKVKPTTPEESKQSKGDVFAGLRAWLRIDSDTTEANRRAAELIGTGVAPLDAVKQAQKECKGRGSEACTVAQFVDELSKYHRLADVLEFTPFASLADVDEYFTDSDRVVIYHSITDDDTAETIDKDETGVYQVYTATATVLGVQFTEICKYAYHDATWLRCYQALRSANIPHDLRAKAARRGKDLRKQAEALTAICNKLLSIGASPDAVAEWIPAEIRNAEID